MGTSKGGKEGAQVGMCDLIMSKEWEVGRVSRRDGILGEGVYVKSDGIWGKEWRWGECMRNFAFGS